MVKQPDNILCRSGTKLISGPRFFHAVIEFQIFFEFSLAILGIITAFSGGITAVTRIRGTSGHGKQKHQQQEQSRKFFHHF